MERKMEGDIERKSMELYFLQQMRTKTEDILANFHRKVDLSDSIKKYIELINKCHEENYDRFNREIETVLRKIVEGYSLSRSDLYLNNFTKLYKVFSEYYPNGSPTLERLYNTHWKMRPYLRESFGVRPYLEIKEKKDNEKIKCLNEALLRRDKFTLIDFLYDIGFSEDRRFPKILEKHHELRKPQIRNKYKTEEESVCHEILEAVIQKEFNIKLPFTKRIGKTLFHYTDEYKLFLRTNTGQNEHVMLEKTEFVIPFLLIANNGMIYFTSKSNQELMHKLMRLRRKEVLAPFKAFMPMGIAFSLSTTLAFLCSYNIRAPDGLYNLALLSIFYSVLQAIRINKPHRYKKFGMKVNEKAIEHLVLNS